MDGGGIIGVGVVGWGGGVGWWGEWWWGCRVVEGWGVV